jgi:hypothetical protein
VKRTANSRGDKVGSLLGPLVGFPDNTASEFLEALLAHHGKPVAQQGTAWWRAPESTD